jgi:hypothetical protein
MSGNGRLTKSTTRKNANISMAYGCDKDNNTYCYRLVDGKPRFHRVILGPGWENQPFDYKKLSCYVKSEKGEDSMTTPTPPKEELLAIYQQCEGKIGRVSKKIRKNWGKTKELLVEYGIIDTFGTPILQGEQAELTYACHVCGKYIPESAGVTTIDGLWVCDNDSCRTLDADCQATAKNKQEQTPPEPEGDQPDPAQEDQEPADKSIPENEITVKDVLLYELEQSEKGDVHSEDYTVPRYEAPQRVNLTRTQYEEMAGITEDRRSALSRYCEQQAFESLLQNWATDVFRHSALSREKKLELIGQLLDWRVSK